MFNSSVAISGLSSTVNRAALRSDMFHVRLYLSITVRLEAVLLLENVSSYDQ